MNRFALVCCSLFSPSAPSARPRPDFFYHHRARRRHPGRSPASRTSSCISPRTSPLFFGAQEPLEELKGKCVRHRDQQGRQDDRARGLHDPAQAKLGHFPWDLQPESTMTNANLDGIAQASGGGEITLNYQGGSQKVLVPPGTPIVAFDPGARADLKRGEWIWTNAPGRRQDRGRTPQREQGWRQAASLRCLSCTRVRGKLRIGANARARNDHGG